MVERERTEANGHARVSEGHARGGSNIHDQGLVREAGIDRAIPNDQRVRNGDVDARPYTVAVRTQRDIGEEADDRIAIDARRYGVRRHVCAVGDARRVQARRTGRRKEIRCGEDLGREVHVGGILRSVRTNDIDLDRHDLPGTCDRGRGHDLDSRPESVEYDGMTGVLCPIHRGVHDDRGRVALEYEDAREYPHGLPCEVERREARQSIDVCRNRRWVRENPAIENVRGHIHALAEFHGLAVDQDHEIHGVRQGTSLDPGTDCQQE